MFRLILIIFTSMSISACSQAALDTPPANSTDVPQSSTSTLLPSPTASAQATVAPTLAPVSLWNLEARMLRPSYQLAATVLDGRIYVAGGLGADRTFAVFDPVSGDWESLAVLPDGRYHVAMTTYAGRIYIFGGGRSV